MVPRPPHPFVGARSAEDDATLRRMEAEFDAVMQRLGRQVQDERAQVQEQEAVVGRLTDQLLGVRGRREVWAPPAIPNPRHG